MNECGKPFRVLLLLKLPVDDDDDLLVIIIQFIHSSQAVKLSPLLHLISSLRVWSRYVRHIFYSALNERDFWNSSASRGDRVNFINSATLLIIITVKPIYIYAVVVVDWF